MALIDIKDRKKAKVVILVVMFIYAFYNSSYLQLTTPILATMVSSVGYTDASLANMIITITSLSQIPAFIIAAIIGQRIDKRRWIVACAVIFSAAGAATIVVASNIYLVLVCRAIVGFSSGMLVLFSVAILPDFYEGRQLATFTGIVLAGSGIWGFVEANVSAAVCAAFGWQASYLLYVYGLVPMILFVLFIPSKPYIDLQALATGGGADGAAGRVETADPGDDRHVPPMVIVYTLVVILVCCFIQTLWSNFSIWIQGDLGGTVVQAGLASSFISLFTCAIRLLFGPIYNRLHHYAIHLDIAILFIGLLVATQARSFPMVLVAGGCLGLAMGLIIPTTLRLASETMPTNPVTAQSFVQAGVQLGLFISTFWRLLLNHLGDGSLHAAISQEVYFVAAFFVIAVIFTFVRTRRASALAASAKSDKGSIRGESAKGE